MRLPLPRLRIRTLLVLVAAMALALGAERTWRRWAIYRAMAVEQAGLEEGGRESAQVCRENVVGLTERGHRAMALGDERLARACFENASAFVPEAARQERLTVYHAALKRKYERAAGRPWLAVEPDPPPP